jgi:hypothetical protein
MADPVYLGRLLAAIGVAAVLGVCATVNNTSAAATPAPGMHLLSH